MSLKQAVIHVRDVLKTAERLRKLHSGRVLVGQRTTDDPLTAYEIRVYCDSDKEPEDRRSQSSGSTPSPSQRTKNPASKAAYFKLMVAFYAHENTSEERLLGGRFGPGLYDLVAIAKDALELNWSYNKKTVQSLEFGETKYYDVPLPPRAELELLFQENVLVEDRLGTLKAVT